MEKITEQVSHMTGTQVRKYTETEKLATLHTFKLYLDDMYYNTETSGIDDWKYDILKDTLERRDPHYTPPVGAKIRYSENRTKIPEWMGSMDKITYQETTQAQDWASKIFEENFEEQNLFLYVEDGVSMVGFEELDEKTGEYSMNGNYAEFDVPDFISDMFEDDYDLRLPIRANGDPNKEINKWFIKNPSKKFNNSCKLDGVSCLAVCEKGKNKIKLYTRGDGIVGADISYLAQYLPTLPTKFSCTVVVRGELIIPKKKFKSVYSKKYKNPRNMVAGLINAKTVRKGLKDIDFVVYEEISKKSLAPSEQFRRLEDFGFKVVENKVTDYVDSKTLMEMYIRLRQDYEYDIDGIIVQTDIPHIRNIDGNPEYAFAFKMMLNDNVALATVTDVNWNISKWGKIIPRVFIEPVELSGVTVSKATAFNAKYIEDNRIGQGTVIEITRSGEVIPFILRVVKKSEKPDMPIIPYIWDNTHVHIIAEKCEGTVCIKLAASFFNKMGIKQVGEKRVAKMYDAGFNNVLLMIGASEDDLVKKGKFGKKTANIIVTNICYGLQSITIPDAIGSSGILGYGMGRKRVNALFEGFPDILTAYKSMSIDEIAERVAKIDGFSNKISRVVAVNIKFASSFIGKLSEYATFRDRDVKIMNNTLTGKKYLLTGFRDSTLFADIEAQGATIASSLSGNVTGVIIKEGGGKTGKPVKARSMGIPVYTIYEFRSQVLNN